MFVNSVLTKNKVICDKNSNPNCCTEGSDRNRSCRMSVSALGGKSHDKHDSVSEGK